MSDAAPMLEFATFEEIVAELGRRYPFAIVVTERPAEEQGARGERFEFRYDFSGSATAAVGLLRRAECRLNHALNQITDQQP